VSGAVIDQAIFAGASFFVSFALARWLVPREYGIFATAYAAYTLVLMVHTGMVTEPMVVFGSGRFKSKWPKYLYILIGSYHLKTALIVTLGFLVIALACWAIGLAVIATTYFAFALAVPLMLLMFLVRRGLYVQGRPWQAAIASTIYTGVIVFALAGLHGVGHLSPATAFIVMGGAALVVFVLFVGTRLLRVERHAGDVLKREVSDQHSRYGRWAVGGAVLSWVPGNAFYFVLPIVGGLEASGAFRASLNFVLPILQAVSAVSYLLISRLGQVRERVVLDRIIRNALRVIVCAAVVYVLFVNLAGPSLWRVLYSGRYIESIDTLWIIALAVVPACGSAVLAAGLKAVERPDLVFRCNGIMAAVALSAGTGLALAGGVAGAALGLLVAHVTGAVMMLALWRGTAGGLSCVKPLSETRIIRTGI
jgi:O-antigen/teichoic acid export membrane protein